MSKKIFDAVSNETLKGKAIHTLKSAVAAGIKEIINLRVAADVVAAETVTIGADVYEVQAITTDTTVNTSADQWTNTTNPLNVVEASLSLALGALIRVENEIMKVAAVWGSGGYTLARGASGTTIASHADATDIFAEAAAVTTVGNIPVGVNATLTPTVFTAALADVVNTDGTEDYTAVVVSVNEVLFISGTPEAKATTVAEALTGANNTVDAASYGGAETGVSKSASDVRTPTAQEVLLGNIHFAVPFTPKGVHVTIVTISTGAVVAWDGVITLDTTNNVVSLGNGGAADWSVLETVTVTIVG